MHLRQQIKETLDSIQWMMEHNNHMDDRTREHEDLIDKINKVLKYKRVMSEEDSEYIDCVIYAIENNIMWNVYNDQ